MKKIFLLLVVVLTAASYTHAQTVVVNKNNGTSVTFNASDIKSIEFSPVAENTIEGAYIGKNSLIAFGLGPYNVENATYTISKNADGTINVTSSKETYTGTPMGNIVLDTYTISNLAFDAAKNAYFRIQFTPDLLPADVIGTMVYSQKDETFQVKKGPVFANFVLADEINRAPAKVQSALLEAMQERQVTIGNETFGLPKPFLVLATQNPIEQEGTYPLPEAQVDRFMLKVVIDYPKLEEEKLIIRQNINGDKFEVKPILKADEIIEARKVVRQVYLDEKIEKYIVDIVFATRYPEKYDLKELKDMIGFGGSPRASINLALAARSYAFIKRRGYVIPEDVRAVAHDVLRHRIGLTYEAEASNMTSDEIVSKILNKVEVP